MSSAAIVTTSSTKHGQPHHQQRPRRPQTGDLVIATGLVGEQEYLNGRRGMVTGPRDEENGRYPICLAPTDNCEGEALSLLARNIRKYTRNGTCTRPLNQGPAVTTLTRSYCPQTREKMASANNHQFHGASSPPTLEYTRTGTYTRRLDQPVTTVTKSYCPQTREKMASANTHNFHVASSPPVLQWKEAGIGIVPSSTIIEKKVETTVPTNTAPTVVVHTPAERQQVVPVRQNHSLAIAGIILFAILGTGAVVVGCLLFWPLWWLIIVGIVLFVISSIFGCVVCCAN